MLQESTVIRSQSSNQTGNQASSHIVHAMMHFLLAVRYRRNLVLVALLVAGMLGGLYYATATRYYAAGAQIFIMGSGTDGRAVTGTPDGVRQHNSMPTFESLFSTATVLQGALQYLQDADRIDVAGYPEEAQAALLGRNLSTTTLRGTNIIEIEYRSKDPKAAVAVVYAIVKSYEEFLKRTHKGSTAELIDVFTLMKNEVGVDLSTKQDELEEKRRQICDMGIRNGEGVVHPAVERALALNKAIIEAKDDRAQLESSQVAIETAIRTGADLRQHLMTVADVVGKEFLLNSVGLNGNQSYALAMIERQLLEDQAELEAMQQDFGPNHAAVLAKWNQIELTRKYLMEAPQRITQRLAELQNNELGPMLLSMVRSKLIEVAEYEAALQKEYELAESVAVNLNGQLTEVESLEAEVGWARKMKEELVMRIGAIDLNSDGGEVRMAMVRDPIEPGGPISPNLKRAIMMSLLGGMAVGLMLVYVFDTLDDRFRSIEEMEAQLRVSVLTMVRQLPVLDAVGAEALQMHMTPNATECEAFRTLRTAMELAETDVRHIVVSSAEPGDGKTTVLANLAVSYAQSNKKTLLIDADLRRPGLTALMGMRGIEGLSSIIGGTDDVVTMATHHIRASGVEGLDVLGSGPRPTNPAEMLADRRFAELLAWAETAYDHILIDSPPALATSDTAVIGRLVDGVVMVVQPDKNRRRLVIRAADSFATLKIPLLGVVVNRVGTEGDRGYYGYSGGYGYGAEYGGEELEPGETEYEEVATDAISSNRIAWDETRRDAEIVPKRVA